MPAAKSNERYEEIARALGGKPGVSRESGGGFGATGQLKVNKRIFAMLVSRRLVVKLPAARVDELIRSKSGTRFDPRRDGRLMTEWLVASVRADWLSLAREALSFVGG